MRERPPATPGASRRLRGCGHARLGLASTVPRPGRDSRESAPIPLTPSPQRPPRQPPFVVRRFAAMIARRASPFNPRAGGRPMPACAKSLRRSASKHFSETPRIYSTCKLELALSRNEERMRMRRRNRIADDGLEQRLGPSARRASWRGPRGAGRPRPPSRGQRASSCSRTGAGATAASP